MTTVSYYKTAIGRKVRTIEAIDSNDEYWCLRIHGSIVEHIIGAIMAVDVAALWSLTDNQQVDLEHRINEVIESLHKCSDNGAMFQLDEASTRNLQELQDENLPPPPWEFQITNQGQLEYRTKEEI
jgi:hypothetical protein